MLVQGVVLVPIYLRHVGSAEFGLWLIAGGVALWIGILDPGISALMQQRVSLALGSDRPGRAVGLARRGLRLNAVLAAVMIVAGAVTAGWIARLIDPGATVAARTGWWLVFLSVAGVAAGLMANAITCLGVALRAARTHTLVTIGSALAGLTATLGGLALGWGVLALPLGVVVRWVLQLLGATPFVLRDLATLPPSEREIPSVDSLSLDRRVLAWAAWDKITGTVAMSADLLLIGRRFEAAAVTSYALTKRPVDLLLSLFQRPGVALAPTVGFLRGGARTGELAGLVAVAAMRLSWLLGAATLGTILWLEPLVGWWVGPAQFLGRDAAGILAIGLAVNVFSGLFAQLYFASGATIAYYQINGALSLLAIAGMVIGLHVSGLAGLMIGAVLPRALVALWLFPRLALERLCVAAPERRMIAGELAAAVTAAGTGLAAAWLVPGGMGLRGLVGLFAYALVLGALSHRLRAMLRGFSGAGAT